MKTNVFNQDKIIQIELLEYRQLSIKSYLLIISISILIFAIIGGIINWYFKIDMLYILLGIILMTLTIFFIISQSTYYVSTNDVTLIVAFGEFQLMKNKQILWCEKIDDLEFDYNEFSNYQIPILIIKSLNFSTLTIGYGRPKPITTNTQINYLVFSKLDWKILKHYTKISRIKTQKTDKTNI